MNNITIFTDGACHPKTKSGSWSAVICQGDEQRIITGQVENTTSNRMELMAVIQALESIELTGQTIEIFSDSQYVVCGVNEWLANWILNGWITSTGKPVANRDLWGQLRELLDGHFVRVSWVPRAENIAHGAKSINSKTNNNQEIQEENMKDQNEINRENWRATYNDERNAFVVEQAGWINHEPMLEYVFCETESETGYIAALEKCWLIEDGGVIGEPFVFGEYETPGDFEADVDHILAEAEQRAQSEGIDHFLAVIDAVKVRAFDARYVREEIFDCPGLFDDGPEDAYTWQDDYLDGEAQVEIADISDQCWRLHAVRVVDLNREPLGWAVVVLRYPDLSARATESDIQAASSVELLELDHWPDEFTARFVTQLFEIYMTFGVRFEDPELAELTDFAIFELLSIQFIHENVMDPVWETIEPELVNAIYQGEGELMRDPARWHPKQTNLIQQFAEQMGLPTHVVDQFEAFLRDNMQINDEFDANSPWRYLDEDV